MQILRIATALLALTGASLAVEVAELRNGFTIRHLSRETRNGQVRLYLDAQKTSFVDVDASDVAGYTNEPDAAQPKENTPRRSTGEIVSEASEKQGVDSDFILSVIKQESGGRQDAVSRAGARGLMQLMPGTAAQLGVQDSFNPEENVHGGARYLRELLERYNGDAVKALAAYNAGPAAVDRYKGVPPYRETQAYVQRIVRDYNRSKQNAKNSAASQRVSDGKSAQ